MILFFALALNDLLRLSCVHDVGATLIKTFQLTKIACEC